MRIAYELHKFEYEVISLSPEEFSRWVAYFKMMDRESRGRSGRR
jgi:hypothetical protein